MKQPEKGDDMNKSHKAILLLGQRAWSKIFKANREETAGSRAAGFLRGIVAWPWQRNFEHWHGPTLGSGMLERFVDELHETETS